MLQGNLCVRRQQLRVRQCFQEKQQRVRLKLIDKLRKWRTDKDEIIGAIDLGKEGNRLVHVLLEHLAELCQARVGEVPRQ